MSDKHLISVSTKRLQAGICDLQKHLAHRSIKTTEQYLNYLTLAQQRVAQAGDTKSDSALTVFTTIRKRRDMK